MKHIDNIIIGGGISGYSFASECEKHKLEYTIFEKNKVGGCISSVKFEGIWFEQGGHTIYNSYANTIDYIKENHLQASIIKRKNLPFLFVNDDSKISSVFRNINIFSAAINFIKNKNTPKKNKTIEEYSSKVFGKKNYDNTLKYCFDAVLSQDSRNFPMEYLFKKYPRDKSLPRSFTLDNGLSGLFKDKRNIINAEIINIYKKDSLWIVETDSDSYSCHNLCIATEWHQTAKFLENVIPEIAKHKFQPQTSKIQSVSVVVDKFDIKHLKKIAGLIGKQQFFYSMVSRDIIEHSNLRAFTFNCKDNQLDIENILDKISKLLDIKRNAIKHYESKLNSLPQYHINHSDFINNLSHHLSNHSGLFITGNFFDRLAIENCIKRSYEEFNRLKRLLNKWK